MGDLSGFIGTWEEQCKDGLDDMAKKLLKRPAGRLHCKVIYKSQTTEQFVVEADFIAPDLPEDTVKKYKETRTKISYTQKNDNSWQIDVGVVGGPTNQFNFELGKSYKSNDLDGTPMKSLINAEGSTLKEEHTYEDGAMNGMNMAITRSIQDDGAMRVETTMCGHTMVSLYKRA
ncbi:uncharacterized protein [Argopecten irradians]|uniref:uncharacterized protein isoform X1 n=1 Tax=Argopecten irradians TaxID=31199 RepID=UPI00371AE7B0